MASIWRAVVTRDARGGLLLVGRLPPTYFKRFNWFVSLIVSQQRYRQWSIFIVMRLLVYCVPVYASNSYFGCEIILMLNILRFKKVCM